MKKFPKKIKVGRTKYKIIFDDNDVTLQGDDGVCFGTPAEIHINQDTPVPGSVLLEEIIHAVELEFDIRILVDDAQHSTLCELLYVALRENNLLNSKIYNKDAIEKKKK